MLTLLSGKNLADPQDDYDETDPGYMREGPSVVKAKSKKSKGKQSAAVDEEGGQQRKRGKNKSAAVILDSDDDVPKDTQSVEGKKKGKKKVRDEIVIDVDELPTPLTHNPPAAASVSAPAPADTVSRPVVLPTPASAPVPAAAMALNARDDTNVPPTPVSRAGPQNSPFATSPNEVQDILMRDAFGNLDDDLNSSYTESSSRLEDNDISSPTSKPWSCRYTIFFANIGW
jgi:hypothetical protein